MRDTFGPTYKDKNGKTVAVTTGLPGTWLVGRLKPNGSVSRIKSDRLPVVDSRLEAERVLIPALAKYAADHGWQCENEQAIEPEVLPAEPAETKPAGRANILAIAPERTIAERAAVIADYHNAAATAYAQSAMYALLCGFELLAAKAQVAHGKWEPWVGENCPFSPVTAWRYMEAAKRKFKAIPNLSHVKDFALGMSPLDLPDERRTQLIEAVKEATDNQTWRQLGLELGFFKESKTGYQKYHPRKNLTAEEQESAIRAAVGKSWHDLLRSLQMHGIDECTWGYLSDVEKEVVVGLLDEVSKTIKKALRGKK